MPLDLTKITGAAAAAAVVVITAGAYLITAGPLAPAPAPAVTVTAPTAVDGPQEDEPGWDCRTMGNRVCGPLIDLNHPALLAYPGCTFAAPDRADETPCVVSVTRVFEGPDAVMHTDCAVTLVNDEDARLECTDGTGVVTFTEES